MKLSSKIHINVLLAVGAFILIFGWMTLQSQKEILDRQQKKYGAFLSKSIAETIRGSLEAKDYPSIQSFLNSQKTNEEIFSIQVLDRGRVVAEFESRTTLEKDAESPPTVLFPSKVGNSGGGEVRLEIASPFSSGALSDYIKTLILLTGIFLLVFFIYLKFIIRKLVIERINDLAELTERQPDGKFPIASKNRSEDELERLGEKIAQMNRRFQERIQLASDERERFYSVLDQLPAALHLQAPDYTVPFGNKMFRDRFGNPAALRCYSLMHNLSAPCEVCSTLPVLDTGKTETSIWTALDGRTYQTVVRPYTDLGGAKLVIELAIDITQQKEVESRLIQEKEVAEKANQAKSEFLSRMSHELRTPLNAILGFCQLIQSDTREPLSQTQKELLGRVLKAGYHLLDLINEILDLARIDSGNMFLSLENVSMAGLIKDIMNLMIPMSEEYKIQILDRISDQEDIFVCADRIRLKQAILNLVVNGIKYNKDGGTVTLFCEPGEEGRVLIRVVDTGMGVSRDQLEEMFEPFNRLNADNLKVEGTGIGLTITRKLVELMGGSVTATSAPNLGSCFTVEIPKGEKPSLVDEFQDLILQESEGETDTGIQHKILYVEDNPDNLELVRQVLTRRPQMSLLTAPQAKLGLDIARAHRPDLILMDIHLPGMDGISAMRYLRSFQETKNIPVIAVSADAMQADISKAMDEGFQAYITKPINVSQFLESVDRILEKQKKIPT